LTSRPPARVYARPPFDRQGMKVIGLLSQKGGTGKSTIACHLATAASAAGYHAGIIDLDPQQTLCAAINAEGRRTL
jgi:cellulose biosynthesis protein BcsQ